MDEEEVHTPSNPYCLDMSCSCHTDWQYHAAIIHEQELGEPTDEMYVEALDIFGVTRAA